jgi:hypothetical protein
MRTEAQTDRHDETVAFRKVASDPETGYRTCEGRTRQATGNVRKTIVAVEKQ